jgi:hypothetical protein
MLSRTERIDGFHLRLSRTEKELYEEFLKTEEAALVLEMQQYFAQAKGHVGGIRFDNASLWSKIENRVGVWFAEVRADRNQNEILIRRSKEAILHRMRNLLATTIRESLGRKQGNLSARPFAKGSRILARGSAEEGSKPGSAGTGGTRHVLRERLRQVHPRFARGCPGKAPAARSSRP